MPLVVGVTFRRVGKVYYFDPGDLELHEGDFVIAETARGVEFGEVVLDPRDVSDDEIVSPLKRVVRVANGDDLDREAGNRGREKNAYEICDRKIAEHKLPMKLLEAEYSFDGSQVTFSFSADGRVDFRELVKDIASILKVKVQLHQIGVRDEAKLIGGYGGCGRELCCASFLSSFEPISMKMAKDQSLFLNPAKFSGCCGKLMCCLRYEHEHYKAAQKRFPSVGAIIPLENGRGKVVDVNMISGTLTVQTEEEVLIHIHASKIPLEGLCRRHGMACNMGERNCEALVANEDYVAGDDEDDDEDDAVDAEIAETWRDENVVARDVARKRPVPDSDVTFREPRSVSDAAFEEDADQPKRPGQASGESSGRKKSRYNRRRGNGKGRDGDGGQ